MKKTLFIIIAIIIIFTSMAIIFINNNINAEKDVAKFNMYFENYLDRNLYGTEVATLIGKAIDNNQRYEVPKDEKGMYISDNKYSIKIHINLVGSSKTYEMETINKVGIPEFISNFNSMTFKILEMKYHKETKRVSEIYIQEVMD